MEENHPIQPENVGYVAHPEDVDEPKYQSAIVQTHQDLRWALHALAG
jgi:hypothetical protein